VDSQGWPTADAQILLFDDRPFSTYKLFLFEKQKITVAYCLFIFVDAWAPPEDDPLGIAPDESGVYHFTFSVLSSFLLKLNNLFLIQGKADVSGYTFGGLTSSFDASTYTTTGSFTVR
jgi:hypothetical protein